MSFVPEEGVEMFPSRKMSVKIDWILKLKITRNNNNNQISKNVVFSDENTLLKMFNIDYFSCTFLLINDFIYLRY